VPDQPRQEALARGKVIKTVGASAAAIGSVIGGLSAALTSYFLIRPNLVPSTENHAEIRTVAVEPGVTLQQYFQHPAVRHSLDRLKATYPDNTRRLLEGERPRMHVEGFAVHFEVKLKGLRDVDIAPRWSLFDGDSGRRLSESELLDPLPLTFRIEKKDADSGAWEIWDDTSGVTARTFL
jgi:hypothetical protein